MTQRQIDSHELTPGRGPLLTWCIALCLSLFTSSAVLANVKGPIEVSSPDLGAWEAIGWSFEADLPFNIGSVSSGGGAGKFTPWEVIIERYTDENTVSIIAGMIPVAGGATLGDITISRGDLTVTLGVPYIIDYSVTAAALIPGKNRFTRSRASQVETFKVIYQSITYAVGEQSVCFSIVLNELCD